MCFVDCVAHYSLSFFITIFVVAQQNKKGDNFNNPFIKYKMYENGELNKCL